jgi:Carboxypeptidase regulatory-like domain
MYHPQKGISIPVPCHEQWQNMTAAANGRHCNACSKTIVDFTAMSEAAVMQYLRQHQNVCGRFRSDQLSRPLKKQSIISKLFSMKKIAATIISFIIVKCTNAQLPVYDTRVYTWIRSALTDSVILAQQKQFKETNGTIIGVVTDENAKPLKGASVTIGNNLTSTITDETGNFSLVLPPGSVQPYTTVSIAAPGKKTEVRTLHYTSLPYLLLLRMEPPAPCACPVIMGNIKPRCCDISISATVDQLFVKEKPVKRIRPKARKARTLRTARTSASAL